MFATEVRTDGPARELVRALADTWTFHCEEAQVAALFAYADLLLRWNTRINLTAARSIDALVAEHFPDAFALARRLEGTARLDRVVDVGSGGGLPAIPLALLRRGLSVELVEPIAKKVAFLRTAIRDLDLGDRVSVRVARGDGLARAIKADRSDGFDVAISRATLAPAKWVALGGRLVRPGGRVFVLTTAKNLPELADREPYCEGRRALIQVVVP